MILGLVGVVGVAVLALLLARGALSRPTEDSSSRSGDRSLPEEVVRAITSPSTVLDEFREIEDGASITWKLKEGSYEIFVSSDTDINVSVSGSDCSEATRVKEYRRICRIPGTATLFVKNPTILGLARAAAVSVKVVLSR